jgi:hypothetical protein
LVADDPGIFFFFEITITPSSLKRLVKTKRASGKRDQMHGTSFLPFEGKMAPSLAPFPGRPLDLGSLGIAPYSISVSAQGCLDCSLYVARRKDGQVFSIAF